MDSATRKQLEQYCDRIAGYPLGYEFTIFYRDATPAQQRGLMWVINACEERGLIKCVSCGLSFEDIRGESGSVFHFGEATYKRI